MSAPASPSGDRLLVQVREDLSIRWQRGERPKIESYLEQYPHLANDPGAVLDLVFAEIGLRVDHLEAPTVEEYVERFHQHADAIRRRWAIHQLLAGSTVAPRRADSEAGPLPLPPPGLPQFPGFRVVQVIGEGGMGVVFKAWQEGVNRFVALKTISVRLRQTESEVQRFYHEIEATGRLDHPHTVGIHTFGEHEGQLYFVMEFLPGGSLKDRLAAGVPPFDQTAALLEQLARGIQSAHEQGIVHRDLKPGNILFDSLGKPRIADFGLARLANRPEDLTEAGAILGTPWYMAPEQADGRPHEVTASADVWALGTILFECLTGKVPYNGLSQRETLDLVRNARPVSPRRVDSSVPVGLDRICRRCLQKNPKHRYPSAATLAADLRAYLVGQQIEAPKRTWPNWCRPWQAALVGLVALLGGAALAMGPDGKPADPMNRIESQLAQGKPVTLIGKAGPSWSNRVLGVKPTAFTTDEKGWFTVMTQEVALVELVPDPRSDRFRLSAKIRHLKRHQFGGVGLYVGRIQYERQQPVHTQATIVFDDIFDEPQQHRRAEAARGRQIPGGPRMNSVWIGPCALSNLDWGKRHSRAAADEAAECFQAFGREGGPVRSLAVEVTPNGISVFWDNGKKPVATYSAADYRANLDHTMKDSPPKLPTHALKAEWNPRGGVGLLVSRGSASYHDVVIEPLTP